MTSPWKLTIGQTEYPLVPSRAALAAIEGATREPIYSILQRGRETGGFMLDHLAAIVTALVGAGMPHDASGFVAPSDDPIAMDYLAMQVTGGNRAGGYAAADALFEDSLLKASLAVIDPLAMALTGKLHADGTSKADGENGAVE